MKLEAFLFDRLSELGIEAEQVVGEYVESEGLIIQAENSMRRRLNRRLNLRLGMRKPPAPRPVEEEDDNDK